MGNLTWSQAAKYGVIVGVGVAAAKLSKVIISETALCVCKRFLPEMYNDCLKRAIEKRTSKES